MKQEWKVSKMNPHQVVHSKKNFLFQMITHLMNLHKMCRGKDLKGNEGNGLGIGGLLRRRLSAPPLQPQNIEEALTCENSKEWECAMREEYDSLMTNNTWTLVPLLAGRKPVSCKWVFKIKQGANGEVERYKAKLVARGFTQTYGVDYNETFALVAKFTSIRCIVALATLEDMEVHQMDMKTAFLNGKLEEEIYMEQPQGFMHQGGEHLVCKLHKSLYCLK
jgi:hypothetical protein